MLKLLFFVAITVNVILIVSSGTTSKRQEKTSSSSSKSSSSSATHKDEKSESSSSTYSSEAASSSSSSESYTNSDDSDSEECSSNDDRKCGLNEQFSKCPDAVCQPKTCDQLGFPISCPAQAADGSCPGKPGCICKDGYVRNSKGKCIPTSHCPSCGGDKNARAGCGVNCNKHCSDVGQEPGGCIEVCYFNACDCKDNYFLDDNTGKCVLPDQCTQTCPKYEVFSNCTNGGCDKEDACEKGCVCIDGYIRSDDGTCKPISECPTEKCGANEQYSDCPDAVCQPKSCDQLGFPISCPAQPADGSCPGKPGCVCKDGYVRNSNGKCIPTSHCPSCGGDENAQAGCGVNCNKHCSDVGQEPGGCIEVCYFNACDCKDNYFLDDNTGKCVLPDQCTQTCPKYEVFSNCTNGGCDKEDACEKGCVCIDGYIRSDDGTCKPKSECPTEKCEANEQYSDCPDAVCQPKSCDQLGFPISCPAQSADGSCPGKPGCVCKDGYVRNSKGKCIPTSQCPSCGGDENAQAGCGVNCNKHCSDVGQEPGGCIDVCYFNACDCKDNYFLDDNTGKCVLPDQCTPTCPKYEVFSNCTNGGCDARLCSQLGTPVPCVNLVEDACEKGCVCIDGYLRTDDGTCVPKSECPTKICGENEQYSDCPDAVCEPKSCDQLGFPISCPAQPTDGSCPGKPGCVCKDDYVRNSKGKCIPRSHCPSCGGDENAKAGCGVNCNRHCSDIGQEPGGCAAVCYFNACDCKDNYFLDDNTGKCVLPDQCTPTCPKFEVFSNCTNGGCDARNCSQLGKPVPCVNIIEGGCEKGCVCIDGYLRADNGTCIPKSECPSCNGDPNATEGCGINCGRHCSNYNSGPVACPAVCLVNGCDCRKDYVYDDNTGKCVLPKDCTPICKQHEVYSDCINGGCEARNCSQLGKPVPCFKLSESACIKGCVCEEGYLRDCNGECIPKDKCPNQNNDCPTNEVFDKCSYEGQCSPGTCDSIGKSYSCPADTECKAECRCKKGYYRNELKQCISEDECSKCTGKNEVYDLCPYTCPPQTCESLDRAYACPVDPNDSCKPACRCLPGFYRNKNGQCVTEKDCDNQPCKKCKQNEIYVENPDSCQVQKCSQLGYPVSCPDQASTSSNKPACLCADGYLRNSKGICIPKDKCPSCGGDPNAKSGCGLNCGRLCSNYNKGPVPCPRICKVNACDCKDEYVLDENINKCVLPKNCPPTTTKPPGCGTPVTESPVNESALDRFSEGNTDFTLNFLYQMVKKNPLASVVMSPFLILIPLAELTLYTQPGESYDQLMNALNLNNKDEIRSVFPALLDSLKAQQNVTLDLGAKIYVNENYQLTDNFQRDTKDIFDAEAENVNFEDSEKAADIINAWVEEITRGLIKKLVTPDMFDAYTRLVLTNGIYFLGNWVDQFDADATQNDDFHVSKDKTIQVPMMYRKGSYKYTESSDLDCKIVELPYKGGNFSYVMLVPNQIDGYSTLAEKIRDPNTLNKALDALEFEKCYLYAPRHEIASTINLVEILNLLNITYLFDDSKSNLSGILTNDESLAVTDAIQKAIIKFDEKGTEAAAVTAIVVGTTSVGQPETVYEVRADHPFIFLLYQDRQPLFCGAYAGN